MLFTKLALVAAAALANAQRPSATPICDYYTTALLKNNTAQNQLTLLTLLVNTVVIGNYTQPNVGVKVPGILAEGQVNGTKVNLLPYFNGELKSTNRGGNSGVSVNFLDGGGAKPLMKNMPADDDKSNQYFLLTHLYQFFGSLLGCSMQGMPGFAAYAANPSMYKVHKFMDLNYAETTYFITQVALAAASFGVAEADIKAVGEALGGLFNVRCAPPTTVITSQQADLQSICIDEKTCPLSKNDTCKAYDAVVMPEKNNTMSGSASGTSVMPSGTMRATGTSTPSRVASNAASAQGLSLMAVAAGIAALAL